MAARHASLPPPTGAESLRGIGAMLLGYIVIVAADAAVKWALPAVGVAMAMILRGLIGGLTLLLLTRPRALRPTNSRLLLWRGLLHCCVSAAWYWAWLRGMSLVDAYAIAAVAPLAMTMLALPLLGERASWGEWCATAFGFFGVLIMLQPGGDLWRVETPLLLCSVVVIALTRIWTRRLAATDGPAAVAFWLLAAHIPIGLLLLPIFPPPPVLPSLEVMLALLVFGVANAMAHFLFARAFALSHVRVLAPFEYTPLLLGGVLGYVIFLEVPTWTTIAGSMMVVAAGITIYQREAWRRAAERRYEARRPE